MNPPPAKKTRLTTACNECRRRKVKCDANYPKCTNCCSRNSECFTSDPKRPEIPVVREWVDVPEKPTQNPPPAPMQNPPPIGPLSEREGLSHEAPEANYLPPAIRRSVDLPQPSPQPLNNHTPSINGNLGTPVLPETNDVSPVQQPHDMSFNLDFVNNRFKMLGASSAQCLTKSFDIYLKSYNVEPVSALFRHGMQHAEEMELPLSLELLPFPDYSTREAYLTAYFTRLHVYYPITDIDDTKAIVHRIAPLPDLKSVSYTKVPLLAIAYLLMSLGADELNGAPSGIGTRYLRIGAALAGQSINFPYLTTVQCLLLLAICYRGRNKDGLAWGATGTAVRIAQSMGLHRHSAVRPSEQHGIQRRDQQLFHARIWAVCCCLEKMGQLECGRPSAIGVVNTDQMMAADQRAPGHDFLQWNMALAEVQHDISTHLYGHQPGERTAKQILLDTARLDKKLLLWPSLVPAELRPGNDLLCGDNQLHLAAFMSFQYHQSVIAVHRAALIQPITALQREIDKLLPDNDARYRLRGGEAICVSSARAVARITIELMERKLDSRLLSAGPALLACVVLATFIIKNPGGRMQLSDLELLKAVTEWTSAQFRKTGMDEQFSNGATIICERTIECLARWKAVHNNRPPQHSLPNISRTNASSSSNATSSNGYTINNGSNIFQASPNDHLTSSSSGQSQQANLRGGSNSSPASNIMGREHSTMQIANILLDNASHTTAMGSLNDGSDLSTLPFEGYNLEELWNWMDSGGDVGGFEGIDWANSTGFEDH
ncbi:hypothetical protein M438DRAFT_369991 [Aureobasidium pullulans EXF-150]|uniref:Zn(2)-C6 fungal-type domain-containing protein n=1 Tax=Aureobasidium pullulans EXF-150 TaxID=1043002 RepID=A0A074XVN1_AURPU|nr:uncharacterized protein M438DRAFT_369991 [Aureobasidium pullulans EXF-150]KEQ78726.1 hypothetical protein M438DRAFT_369991 [Aureobasidium pullulans EXF-150]